jgi:hypothetical protein
MWQHTPVITAIQETEAGNHKFESSRGYVPRAHLKISNNNRNKKTADSELKGNCLIHTIIPKRKKQGQKRLLHMAKTGLEPVTSDSIASPFTLNLHSVYLQYYI